MQLHRARAGTSLLGLLVLIMTVSTPALAGPRTTVAVAAPAAECGSVIAPGSDDAAVVSLMGDYRLDRASAERRLNWQGQAPGLSKRLQSILGDRFGGVWIQPATGRLAVGVVGNRSPAAAAVSSAATVCGVGDAVDTVTVAHSQKEINAASTWLGERIAAVNATAPNALGSYSDVSASTVTLTLPRQGGLTATQSQLVVDAQRRYGTLLRTQLDDTAVAPAQCGRLTCTPPLRAGVQIKNPSASCTLGFLARSNSDNKLYAFTAGHCHYDSSRTSNWTSQFDGADHVIGKVHNYVYGNLGDAAIIAVNNPAPYPQGWGPRAWVLVHSSADTAHNESYPIRAYDSPVLNSRVCKTGYAGGTDCGTYYQQDVTATYTNDDGTKTTMVALQRANFCVYPGDSGGPVYANNTAYGLVSGYRISDNCAASLFMRVVSASILLNVRVATGS